MRQSIGLVSLLTLATGCGGESARGDALVAKESSPVVAEDLAQVAHWFCGVLKAPFSFRAALGEFPGAPFSDPVREESVDPEFGTTIAWTVSNGRYVVRFTEDVEDTWEGEDVLRGYMLKVGYAGTDQLISSEEEARKWLSRFGRPESRDLTGEGRIIAHYVGAGPSDQGGHYPLEIHANELGYLTADWELGGLRYAPELCRN